MLKFILNNTIFDYSIIFLLLINFVLTIIIDLKEQKNESKNILLSDKINKIKMKAVIIAVIFTVITLYIKFNNFKFKSELNIVATIKRSIPFNNCKALVPFTN